MERNMFCYQCQETFKNQGCETSGVCGKKPHTANLQDLLIYVSAGLSEVAHFARKQDIEVKESIENRITMNLFITITNANFHDKDILDAVFDTLDQKEALLKQLSDPSVVSEHALWNGKEEVDIINKINEIGVLSIGNEDLRSLHELIVYGVKGLAAYNQHAHALGKRNQVIDHFMQDTMMRLFTEELTMEDYIALTMKTGEIGVQAMALLDDANTSTYGNPEITSVNIGVGNRPGILISGHDLKDLEQLLNQSMDSGVDIYTHSEMLPAHYYPFFKKFPHFIGNYGNAWWKQREEFASFHGPILMTTNCLVPPLASYKERVYTTGAVGFEGCKHIPGSHGEEKDFSAIIAHAKTCEAPEEIEQGEIIGGFAHHQVLALADKIVDAVKQGAIKKFVVMAGCDGRNTARSYYTDFAKELPQDSIILTAGCAKYRYNKLNLGDINGIPRLLDAGQCNDSYSLAMIALKLKEVFELEDINDLPIIYNIAWYEQKAVIVLLALLHLGVKDIHLGPTLPAFLSKSVVDFLVENFNISAISSVEEDMKKFFPSADQDIQINHCIQKNMLISDILRMYPEVEEIFMQVGMGCMGCPASQSETLEDACLVHGLDVDVILQQLNGESNA